MNEFQFAYLPSLERQTSGPAGWQTVAKSEDIVRVIADAIMITHDRQGNRHKHYSVIAKSSSSAKVFFNAIHSGCYGRARRFFICSIRWAHRAISAGSRIRDAHHRPTIHHELAAQLQSRALTKRSPNPNIQDIGQSAWPNRNRIKYPLHTKSDIGTEPVVFDSPIPLHLCPSSSQNRTAGVGE